MTPLSALAYSFLFGLLHGVMPDEHTWPITFSYAIGSGSRAGMKAGLYFSAAFTLQRMIIAEASYLALAPFLLRPIVNGIVYLVVGAVMSVAGAIILRGGDPPHVHLLGHHHDEPAGMEPTRGVWSRTHTHAASAPPVAAPPVGWTLVHGFIAGFGFGGFSLFINTVAAPAMPSAWVGFLPGLLFGFGTAITLVAVGAIFGASLKRVRGLTPAQVARVGAGTGGRTLFYGGFLFMAAGAVAIVAWTRHQPIEIGAILMTVFLVLVVIPALIRSIVEARGGSNEASAR